ncbi:MAG: vWA domain-containing protein [Planctomycetota bacterium]
MFDWHSIPLRFQYPELLLLGIPLGFAFWRWGRARGVTGWLRVSLLLLLLLVLTAPEWDLGGRGIDVVAVVDRSRSMTVESEARIVELLTNLQKGRGAGDRVGVVTFGQQPAIELMLSRTGVLAGGGYTKQILPDGSDLEAGLQTALNLVDPNRPSRILVLSDGEANGSPVAAATRRAQEMRVPIDYRGFERIRTGDLAVEAVILPEIVAPREPFQFSAIIYADKEAEGKVTVSREGRVIASQTRHFSHGSNQILFRDLLENGGLHAYDIKLDVANDPLVENNRGAGVVRVEAGPRLLVLNQDGQEDNYVRALKSAKLPVDVAKASTHPLTQDALERYRAVILENVPARDFGRLKMERLAQYVEDLGGGLMLTGGERSFGTGGYFKSPLDPVLPVSMEVRQEHRKLSLAMAIVLDRSGSMAVPVKGNKTKMELADMGTAECIRMLSAGDSVAVIAVDSAPHVIQALIPVEDPEAIASKVLKIRSEGGGIFVYEGLVAAGDQLLKAEQLTKHIILFSDAQDSEEPGDYRNLLAKYEQAGITTSVIGLGNDTDVDAALLKDIAKLGHGNIMFTTDAEELPRLFTEDTMSVARSSFVKKDQKTQADGIAGRLLADARLMGELKAGTFPNVDGYNLSYLKTNATMGVVSQDEFAAPWSAFWYLGLGRVAAVTVEVDGVYTGQFGHWDQYGDFLITHARWLLGGDQPNEAFLKVEHTGQDALVTLELDPDRPSKQQIESPVLTVVPPGDEREKLLEIPFEWQGANTLQARFKLSQTGTYRPLVKLGAKNFVRGPTVTLPYSPEFAPREAANSGLNVLKSLAEKTGGKARVNPVEMLADPPRASTTWPLGGLLFLLSILVLILEIAGRRLSLWEKVIDVVSPVLPQARGATIARQKTVRAVAPTRPAPVPPTAAPTTTAAAQTPPVTPAVNPLEQAKARAKRRSN